MYTVYPTRLAAVVANAEAAAAVGCDLIGTTEWHQRINHPFDGRSALLDGVGPVTEEQLEADGWFPLINNNESIIQ